jgi:ABC-type glycerol-3-phosphate transport system permease component
MRDFQLLGSLWAVILPAVGGAAGFGVPLGVFLMRSFYQDLPNELAEAARVDGTSEFQLFRKVILPLSLPGVSVLAVLVFFQSWNQFLMPLLYLSGEEQRPLATGLYNFCRRPGSRIRVDRRRKHHHDRSRIGHLLDLPAAVRQGHRVGSTQGLTPARSQQDGSG